jgi:hypothetical protein
MDTVLQSPHFLIILYFILQIALMFGQDDQFIYHGFHEANLHLDGIAEIHPNGLLQLTNISNQQVGYAFYPLPIKFNTSSSSSSSSFTQSLSFSTNFVFAIDPQYPGLGAHGIALPITPSLDFSHAVASQYLGLFNASNNGLSTNHILAIELDTVLSPDIKDRDNNHVGIDVNSLNSIE